MRFFIFAVFYLLSGGGLLWAEALVYQLTLEGEIGSAQVFIVRRVLRQASSQGAQGVVLVLNTPGGASDAMIEIMDALDRYEGKTWAYIDPQALSAGAYIAGACEKIYFSPKGVMGAAAPVLASGEDISETMRLKFESFLDAKIRSFQVQDRYRAAVLRAMSDKNFVLVMDGQLLKKDGELLTLTAQEAIQPYGEPPEPLLAAGIVPSVDALLDKELGMGTYRLKVLELLGVERLVQGLQWISPVLLGLGLLALFIEFKTPGFGFFGILGIVFLGLVFLGQYVAGLAGYEAALLLVLGLGLLFFGVFVIPGSGLFEFFGITIIFAALIWVFSGLSLESQRSEVFESLMKGLSQLILGLAIAVSLGTLFSKFLPKGLAWERMVLKAQGRKEELPQGKGPEVKAIALTLTPLVPTGLVELNGKHYEARAAIGMIPKGVEVEVLSLESLGVLVVQPAQLEGNQKATKPVG